MKSKTSSRLVTVLAIPTMLISQQASADWEWSVAPYLWVSDVGMDLSLSGEPTLAGSGIGIVILAQESIRPAAYTNFRAKICGANGIGASASLVLRKCALISSL